MIIQSDRIHMNSRRSYQTSQANYVGGSSYFLAAAPIRNSQTSIDATKGENSQKQTNSGNSNLHSLGDWMKQMQSTSGVRRLSLSDNVKAFNQIQQRTLDYLLYTLFGRRPMDNNLTSAYENSSTSVSDIAPQADVPTLSPQNVSSSQESYYSFFYYSEQETTCFDASGTAITADGREIPFSISLEMSRSFTEMAEQHIQFDQPRLCDPLVINLDSNAANVSDQKFLFDIDADGKEDSISMLGAGSGYLALDKNEDGIINDGNELFGTASGNGFKDLAEHDKDGNGWIDEADAIFSKLRIWTKDANGNDKLLTLKDAGVGAIYLGYEKTDFSLNSLKDNTTNAVIRKSGLFLYEDGTSGTVQQLDLAT